MMQPSGSQAIGRIDIHSHLLPGVDDGCRSIEDSIQCARRLVQAGYTHAFCTPHIWPNLDNTAANIVRRVARLNEALRDAGVPLKLHPGGEHNLRPDTPELLAHEVMSYGCAGKFILADLWADALPPFFDPVIRWLQSRKIKVILAHPERMKAVQNEPELMYHFQEMGILLQCNLQCLGDPSGTRTRELAERFLAAGRYTFLGSDTHNSQTLPIRMSGLARASELIGEAEVTKLTVENPRRLLEGSCE